MAAVVLGLALLVDHRAGYVILLLGTWIVFESLIRAVAPNDQVSPVPPRRIPIHFSGGLGRFELRSRGDGRRVEVRTGDAVVAELIATDDGDELSVDFSIADEPDADAFGAAIGLAIEMVTAADADSPSRPEQPASSAPAGIPGYRRGGLLPRLRRA